MERKIAEEEAGGEMETETFSLQEPTERGERKREAWSWVLGATILVSFE